MDITLLLAILTARLNSGICFNPCFNGYYTFTHTQQETADIIGVSILVLMDITLLQCKLNGWM